MRKEACRRPVPQKFETPVGHKRAERNAGHAFQFASGKPDIQIQPFELILQLLQVFLLQKRLRTSSGLRTDHVFKLLQVFLLQKRLRVPV